MKMMNNQKECITNLHHDYMVRLSTYVSRHG